MLMRIVNLLGLLFVVSVFARLFFVDDNNWLVWFGGLLCGGILSEIGYKSRLKKGLTK